MFKLIICILFAASGWAKGESRGVSKDDQRVNHHLARTNSKIEIQRQKALLENQKTAPSLDRTPTFEDPAKYKNYGVEMQQKLPFDDLDLDHLDPEEEVTFE
jgi:hypothetical protein